MVKSFLILVGGGTGSGKTTVAEEISKQGKKKNVLLISMDHYYKDLGYLDKASREKTNFDNPNAIDWHLLKKDILDLLIGKTIKMPVYSFKTHTRVGHKKMMPKKIIIIEGIFALYDLELNKISNLRLFVDTSPDLRFIRRLLRDIKERKRTVDSVVKQWLRTVKPMHDEFIESTKQNAHIIIPEDPEGGLRKIAVELIKTKIKSLV